MLRDQLPKIKTPLPGPNASEWIKRRGEAVPDAISCEYPCVISRGEGAMIEDVDGNVFLDWVGGVGVLNIGYSEPEVIEAVKKQAERYFHGMPNIVTHEGYVKLAEKLNAIVPVKEEKRRTMFANSGAEANENAIKIAREATGRPNVIAFTGAFHGRTLLTISLTAKKAYSEGQGPFPAGICRAPYPYMYRGPKGYTEEEKIEYYISELEQIFIEGTTPTSTAAVILEPIQGEGGFIPAPLPWVKALRKICDQYGILLIADEVQTGFARTGKMFASDYWKEANCAPDIITMAKSIGAGMPLSAITAGESLFDKVKKGTIGGTFGGNVVACAAALETIAFIERENLCQRSLDIASNVRATFERWKEKYSIVGDVRGVGCMMGIEFIKDVNGSPAPELVQQIVKNCAQNGLLIESAGTYGNVIRFLSPLVVTDAQVEAGLSILEQAISQAS